MGDQVEGKCPLCMEEMDLTDKLLKPCKCGYEICLWCWHHIIEMAEKENTEGQCPACRNPYDKERRMGIRISNDRLAEMNAKRKQKLQKTKAETSEKDKDLSNLRVILRNLVYMAGIPLKLADEKTLRRKEYLGQYGKIIKLVITRNVETQQNFPNSCIVYVTFSKKEEAVRCIQVVDGYILDGSPLKACFGTTRYCYAWLRNMPCRNSNCLYFHEAGPPEDICTKDEVIAACTSKTQQCSGTALNDSQRRSGSLLPPPVDLCSDTRKTLDLSAAPSSIGCGRNLRSGDNEKSDAFPAATSCGSRILSGRVSYASIASSERPLNTSSISNSLVTSPTGLEAHAAAKRQSEPQEKAVVPNFDTSLGTNIPMIDTVSRSYCFSGNDVVEKNILAPYYSDSNRFAHLLSTAVDFNRQASSSIFCSATDRVDGNSGCQDNIANDFISAWDYPATSSMEDSIISSFQAMTVGSGSASQEVPDSWDMGCSDLELVKSCARFEATDSLLSSSRDAEGISCSSTSGIIDRKLGEFSSYASGSTGNCSPEMLQIKFSGCDRQYIDFYDKEHQSGNHVPFLKDVVQHIDVWDECNIDPREDSTISDKTNADLRENSIVAGILTLDRDPADGLVKPLSPAEHLAATNRGGNCSEIFDSWLPHSSDESRFSFANVPGHSHSTRRSSPGFTDIPDTNGCYHPLDIVEKKGTRPINGFTVNDLNKYEVHNSNYCYSSTEAANKFEHLPRFRRSASNLKPAISPAPKVPPGFHPRGTADLGQSFSRPMSSGIGTGYQHSGIQSLTDATENTLEWRDSSKLAFSGGKLLQSAMHLNVPDYSFNLGSLDERDSRIPFQSRLENLYPNSMVSFDQSKKKLTQNMAFNGALKNYNGPQEACNLSSPNAKKLGVIGRKNHYGLNNNTTSDVSFFSSWVPETSR